MSNDVKVFRLCDCDAIAARTEDEARQWYKETTGLTDEELYTSDEVEVLSPDYMVHNTDGSNEMISVQEIINTHWTGEPFIAVSTEW